MNTTRISTYLPPWANGRGLRLAGSDEDTVTLAVSCGLDALAGASCQRVVLVTRQPALIDGGSAAVLCAGLGLAATTDVSERLGGAAAALDAAACAAPGTLVIGVDLEDGAAAGALLVGEAQVLSLRTRIQRSLPQRTRQLDGSLGQDDDARLMRERGLRAALDAAALDGKPLAIAGVSASEAKGFCAAPPAALPCRGAASPFFALAALCDAGATGLVAAADQGTLAVAELNAAAAVHRREPPAQPPAKQTDNPGSPLKISLAAYDRAFDAKLRWQAGRCNSCATLAMPPRHRCLNCGGEGDWQLSPLPRSGEIYTAATIHVPVPGLKTPYSLALVQLDGTDVRVLVTVTDSLPGAVAIGGRGTLVFRRIALRSGVPDYGYAFAPATTTPSVEN
ncbi:MAG: Zn-ribbon domain-containing OB-fold protein [Azospira sp.]